LAGILKMKLKIIGCLLGLLPLISSAGETGLRLQSGVSILDEWRADQHLYYVGDLGLGDAQIKGLETWLDKHAEN